MERLDSNLLMNEYFKLVNFVDYFFPDTSLFIFVVVRRLEGIINV